MKIWQLNGLDFDFDFDFGLSRFLWLWMEDPKRGFGFCGSELTRSGLSLLVMLCWKGTTRFAWSLGSLYIISASLCHSHQI